MAATAGPCGVQIDNGNATALPHAHRRPPNALPSTHRRPAGFKPKHYNPLHPERRLLYHTIAEHFETDSESPHVAPARGPPLWEDCDAQTVEGVAVEPD